jgi:hypothetical protein
MSTSCFAAKRVEIIEKSAPTLSAAEVGMLARKSRLLIRSQIEEVVRHYVAEKKISLPRSYGANASDPFGSNTVSPESGWWEERFVNPYYLSGLLKKLGFRARVLPGYYGRKGAFLNPIIAALGAPLALAIASFYTIEASDAAKEP